MNDNKNMSDRSEVQLMQPVKIKWKTYCLTMRNGAA